MPHLRRRYVECVGREGERLSRMWAVAARRQKRVAESFDHQDEGGRASNSGESQAELLKSVAANYIVKSVEREVKKALSNPKTGQGATQRLLDEERRKPRNLVAAIEGGSDAPATLLKAMKEREATIKRLETQVKAETANSSSRLPQDIAPWVREQLEDLTKLLKSDPVRVKSEFRRLNLKLTFDPIEAEPRPHFVCQRPVRLERTGLFLFALQIPGCGCGRE